MVPPWLAGAAASAAALRHAAAAQRAADLAARMTARQEARDAAAATAAAAREAAAAAARAKRFTVLVSAVALMDAQGRCLLAERPEGKSHAGKWEFPGGKVTCTSLQL